MLAVVALYVSALLLGQEDLRSDARRVRAKAGADCVLSFTDPPTYVPLLTNESGIIYPQQGHAGDDIVIAKGKCFTASCSPTTNSLETYSVRQVDVCCGSTGLKTSPGSKSTSFKQLGCSKPITEDITNTGLKCAGEDTAATTVSIEFTNTNNQYSIIEMCHDPTSMNTLWAHNIVRGGSMSAAQISNVRPSFKKAQYYGSVSPINAYKQSSQKKMVAKLVGSASLAEKYISPKESFYFARGHLAPDGDFIYAYEQNATYYYVNVVPQWQVINNGNWKALEGAVRKVAGKCGELEVYTGGHGVLQLKDNNNDLVDIYLATDPKTQSPVLHAPKLTWKMIHCPAKQAAVACVMVNNPHLLGVTSSDIICKDIANQISWITWDIYDTRKGYTYCCKISDFLAAVPNAPKITAPNVLN